MNFTVTSALLLCLFATVGAAPAFASVDERRAEYVGSLWARDLSARDGTARDGTVASERLADANASDQFATFAHTADPSRRELTRRKFFTVARAAPALVDRGYRVLAEEYGLPWSFDDHSRYLAKSAVEELGVAGRAHAAGDWGTADIHGRNAFRLVVEAYALAGANLGEYETIRRRYLTHLANVGLTVGALWSVATVAAVELPLPAWVPVTAGALAATSYVLPLALALREVFRVRFDRPLRRVESREMQVHRARHVDVLIERFWSYVGREIQSQGEDSSSQAGDPVLKSKLAERSSLFSRGARTVETAAVRAVVRERMAQLDWYPVVDRLCDRVLTGPGT